MHIVLFPCMHPSSLPNLLCKKFRDCLEGLGPSMEGGTKFFKDLRNLSGQL